MYKLICMAFDGDYVTEGNIFSDNRAFETIADAPEDLEIFNGRRVKTVAKIFKATATIPELIGADCDEFGMVVTDEARAAFGIDYARSAP